ncbi:hypothetical protein K474DRAFT_1677445 [Panus rudis PR-1116 ss-1]|nr:hypothetical protein K474DRAFT_1677445 [Panus rudis PR-1116 ss-1]
MTAGTSTSLLSGQQCSTDATEDVGDIGLGALAISLPITGSSVADKETDMVADKTTDTMSSTETERTIACKSSAAAKRPRVISRPLHISNPRAGCTPASHVPLSTIAPTTVSGTSQPVTTAHRKLARITVTTKTVIVISDSDSDSENTVCTSSPPMQSPMATASVPEAHPFGYVSDPKDGRAHPWYVVIVGSKKTGIFAKWVRCAPHCYNIRGAIYQKCENREEAASEYARSLDMGLVRLLPEPRAQALFRAIMPSKRARDDSQPEPSGASPSGGAEQSTGKVSARNRRKPRGLAQFEVVHRSNEPGSSTTTQAIPTRAVETRSLPNGRLGQQVTTGKMSVQVASEEDDPAAGDADLEANQALPETRIGDLDRRQKPDQKEQSNIINLLIATVRRDLTGITLYTRNALKHGCHSVMNMQMNYYAMKDIGIQLGYYRVQSVVALKDSFAALTDCTIKLHKSLPLHRMQHYNGKYYEDTSLKNLGLQIQLGHNGDPCPHPARHSRKFVVGDLNGFHELDIQFCGCIGVDDTVVHMWAQLLRVGWFPASMERPTTAFTFQLLNYFQQLTHQAKTNVYDFQRTLSRVTNNSGLVSWVRYHSLTHVHRLWRHLTMLKHAGRVHDPDGIDATSQGSLAIECPACPQPDRNIPNDWQSAPEDTIWLYTLFLMIDANFRLQLKSHGLKDTTLASGWAYYVDEEQYQNHLAEHNAQNIDSTESNTCSAEHKAILNAHLRKEGYIASGVGAILCARHGLVRKNGVGDLQKGERYVNMDYLILSTLLGVFILLLFLSYDIACQFSKNFAKRVDNFPSAMQLDLSAIRLHWGIPKKHLAVHGPNHSKYSFNYLPHVGRTYGEGIESGWSHINPMALSTREMSPGARHETLDDHWGAWNWGKIIGMGSYMGRTLLKAHQMSLKHGAILKEYNATFKPEWIEEWTTIIQEWRQDPNSHPDPYEVKDSSLTMKEIRMKLSEEDAVEASKSAALHHEVSPSIFISMGLELEEKQRDIASKSTSKTSTSSQADLQDKHTTLIRRIELWRKIQEIYMPSVSALLAESLSEEAAGSGQKAHTRIRTLYDKFQQKIKLAAARYRTARKALEILDPNGDWKPRLRILNDSDICGPRDTEELGQGAMEPSWIWLTTNIHGGQVDSTQSDMETYDEDTRVQWVKAKARVERWEEEVKLLQEEMRRVLAFLEWKASWWRDQRHRRDDDAEVSKEVKSGLIIYAEKQAAITEALAIRFAIQWSGILDKCNLEASWQAKYHELAQAVQVPKLSHTGSKKWNTLEAIIDVPEDEEEEGDEEEEEEERRERQEMEKEEAKREQSQEDMMEVDL